MTMQLSCGIGSHVEKKTTNWLFLIHKHVIKQQGYFKDIKILNKNKEILCLKMR